MHDPAATLKDLSTRPNSQPVNMPTGRTKFLYPSGSQPLQGYTIKRGIGVGGFGEVYFAISDAGKEVALKRILRNLDIELRGVRQCLNLKHVNLISLWDIRTSESGESWVVMEYVPGGSLREMCEAYPKGLPEDQVKTWFASIAAGVAYLHEKGIVHRDLKPGNIFYDEDEQVVKIGDYGLSKFISCSRRSGQTESVGTFHYMAPEIGKGVYGKQIDIYAMGIILFELLTGDVPFNGESSQEIIMKHLTAAPDLTTVPAEFRPVIEKSLLKDPDDRYANVPEMLADLPWPDVAENSEKIVTRNSIGPIGSNSNSTEPTVAGTDTPLLGLRQEFNSQPGADIIFGEVQQSSPGNRPDGSIEIVEDVQVVPENQNLHTRLTVAHERPLTVVDQYATQATKKWWQGNLPTPVKVVLLACLSIACVQNAQVIIIASLVAGLGYLLFYAYRVFTEKPKPSSAEEASAAQSSEATALDFETKLRKHIGLKDFGDKSAELLGSTLIATVTSIVICSLSLLMDGAPVNPTIESIAIFVWMALISSLASCGLLACGKLWESRSGSNWTRRLIGALMGAALGAFAYGVALLLEIDFADLSSNDSFLGSHTLPQIQLGVFTGYLVFFAGILAIVRWWRQVDPIRAVRISLAAVGLCWLWAVVFSQLLGFSPVLHSIIALATSVSVQLAAPWLNASFRKNVQRSNAI